MASIRPVILVHGGAWNIPDELGIAHMRGCRMAAAVGWRVLDQGGSAEDAVEAAVRLMEDDETYDAGRGSVLNLDGVVELDASFMEGRELQVGAVAGVRDVANPITLARRILESPHTLLIGEGASRYARQQGIPACAPERLVVPREEAIWRAYVERGQANELWVRGDTVGAVALDAQGHLAAGTSTGGRQYKVPGRVGDVPCVGSGLYADDALGAASSTGDGEAITRVVMAKRAVDGLAGWQHPQQAAQAAIAYLWERVQGRAGIIVLDTRGRVGCAFNTARMARAWTATGEIEAAVERDG